jgi:pathogenesis-related protein 1
VSVVRRCVLAFSVAAAVVVTSGSAMAAPPATGANITEAQQQEIVNQHNLFRAEVGSPPLVWDNAIATNAQKWADAKQADGKFEHSPRESRSGLGENIAGGEVAGVTLRLTAGEREEYQKNPVAMEGQNYEIFGHYTQIVWDKTTKVGCGYAPKGKLPWGLVVCQYGPSGNIPGQFPYPQGTVPEEQSGLTAIGVSKPGATPAGGTTQGGTDVGGTQGDPGAGGPQGGSGGPPTGAARVLNATTTTLPCGSATRSPDNSGGDATVEIVNNSTTPVTISWLSQDGQKEFPVTARPNGGTATLTTFAEDIWEAEAGGQCLTLLKGAGTVTFG